jgi:hypothetical protein
MLIAKRDKWQVCCETLTLSAFGNRGAISVLVGALFKKFGFFLNSGVHTYFLIDRLEDAVGRK